MRYIVNSTNRVQICKTQEDVMSYLRQDYTGPKPNTVALVMPLSMLCNGDTLAVPDSDIKITREDYERRVDVSYDGCRQAHILTVDSDHRSVRIVIKDRDDMGNIAARIGEELLAALNYTR